ncbi:hypothetical protein GLAREA_11269 [Glarea lozoyensis ATCC 20868]|uniref:Uncharacterized protein n=1 Tax=Glarea lozoyensis (strain ATCC 20868 / MF5171) TaxID=1116229 RepID=S3DEM8_GLAL2|nr:uncharacterized protein GLAREA_11269 [Glarea lozoyensis ATCC 20868]EPE35569.1 hypothetical protein GLAREA_11269 [Glarea lozoyensis ATCC 20868]
MSASRRSSPIPSIPSTPITSPPHLSTPIPSPPISSTPNFSPLDQSSPGHSPSNDSYSDDPAYVVRWPYVDILLLIHRNRAFYDTPGLPAIDHATAFASPLERQFYQLILSYPETEIDRQIDAMVRQLLVAETVVSRNTVE